MSAKVIQLFKRSSVAQQEETSPSGLKTSCVSLEDCLLSKEDENWPPQVFFIPRNECPWPISSKVAWDQE
jgi:hypothetical protein